MLCESFLLISRCLWVPFPLSLEHEEEESVPGWAPMGKGEEGFASLIPLEQREKATGRKQPGSLEVWRCFVLCFFKVDGIFIWSNRLSSLLHICFYTLVSFFMCGDGPISSEAVQYCTKAVFPDINTCSARPNRWTSGPSRYRFNWVHGTLGKERTILL